MKATVKYSHVANPFELDTFENLFRTAQLGRKRMGNNMTGDPAIVEAYHEFPTRMIVATVGEIQERFPSVTSANNTEASFAWFIDFKLGSRELTLTPIMAVSKRQIEQRKQDTVVRIYNFLSGASVTLSIDQSEIDYFGLNQFGRDGDIYQLFSVNGMLVATKVDEYYVPFVTTN